MPKVLERINNVREYRLASKSEGTRKIAGKPTHFHVENIPDSTYIVIPETSSENRKYIPMGFMTPDVLCSNAVRLMPNANLYHFGILTSSVHMDWVATVCGRLKSDYRYSKDIVYNNFPWPDVSPEQTQRIEKTAQMILDARAKYPNASLADMYGEYMYLYPELLQAHKNNDQAVMEAYGFRNDMTEAEIVSELMKMYKKISG